MIKFTHIEAGLAIVRWDNLDDSVELKNFIDNCENVTSDSMENLKLKKQIRQLKSENWQLKEWNQCLSEKNKTSQDFEDVVSNFFIEHESEFSQELKDEISLLFDIEWDVM